MGFIKAVSIGAALAMIGFIVVAIHFAKVEPSRPYTYTDMATDEAARCVAHKGDGGWVGSSGLTLKQYCDLVGKAEALKQAKKDHPEQF
jgi:hypothetical protein